MLPHLNGLLEAKYERSDEESWEKLGLRLRNQDLKLYFSIHIPGYNSLCRHSHSEQRCYFEHQYLLLEMLRKVLLICLLQGSSIG